MKMNIDFGPVADLYDVYVRWDTDVPFELNRTYELILLPFHSLSEIVDAADRTRALVRIRNHLAPGGRFVVTLHNPAIQVPRLDGRRRQLCERPVPGRDVVLRVWITARSTDGAIGEALQEYEILDEDGRLLEKRELALRFAIPDRATFEREAKGAGFDTLRLWGDYSRNEFRPRLSPYMIWELGTADVAAG